MQKGLRKRTVVLATSIRLVYDSLQWAISQRREYVVVGAATAGDELLQLASTLKPDIVLSRTP